MELEFFGMTLSVFLISVVISFVIATFFLWLGAKIARVEGSSFGRSMLAALGIIFATWFVSWLVGRFAAIGSGWGFIIGLALTIIVIKNAYDTSWGKSIMVWIFSIVAQIIAALILGAFFGLALLTTF